MTTPKPSLTTLRTVMSDLLQPYKARVFTALTALLISAAMALAIPMMFRRVIDIGFVNRDAIAHINSAFFGLLIVALVMAAGSAIRFYLVNSLGERVCADLRTKVYSHLLVQRPIFFETLKVGEVLSRLSADTTLIQNLVSNGLSFGLRHFITTIGALVMLILTSPLLSGAVVTVVLIVVVPVITLARRVRKLSRASQDTLASSGAIAQEVLTQISTTQAFGQTEWETKRFANSSNASYEAARQRVKTRSLTLFVAIALAFTGLSAVLWLGAKAVASGDMSAGQLTQFVMYAAFVGGGFAALSEVLGEFQRAAGAADRLVELLALNIPYEEGKETLARPTGGLALEFKDLSFTYPSRPEHTVLKNINLSIHAGETIALVGPSGAGKSTLFGLLLRWYSPSSGEIQIEGKELSRISLNSWLACVAYVPQDPEVFSTSIADNIRYANQDASTADILSALQAAAADRFVDQLPENIDTFVGERGTRLSGGERQRLAIARAILRDAPLLLLDEATSALDAESERLVQLAIERSAQGRTTIVIAHRLATVKAANRIIVMDHGQIIETGTHQELMNRNGMYAKLAALQFLPDAP